MDIYQIWTTYNKQWSRYEILAFVGVLILVCTAMAVCVHRKKPVSYTHLAITPINSVALSYLSKINKKTNSLFKWTYIVGIVVCGIGYIMTIILSRPVLSILYPKYVDAAMQYIWITSGTIVVSVLTLSLIHILHF